jgi:CubicO group peptidase (beta-lactamase class C family)
MNDSRLARLVLGATFVAALSVPAACRDPVGSSEVLGPPEEVGDGWAVVAPADAGLNPAALTELDRRVAREEFGHVHALLVVRHGRLAFERYYHEYDATEPHTLQSVTKSVTSALVGIAVDRGELTSLDLTLGEIYPGYADILDADPVKAGVRVRDLLSMQSGMAWDESSYPYSDDRNDTGRMNRSDDWIRAALEQPMDAEPGTKWTYNSGAAILLGGMLERVTGQDVVDYAVEHLFGPLGFSEFRWGRNRNDSLPHTGGGLWLFPRDLARFGQLYLDQGTWNGERVVSREWVAESRTLRATVGDDGYGYMWWMRDLEGVPGHAPSRTDVLFGWGLGGQHVFVADDLDLVVVVMAWNADGSTRGGALFDALVRTVTDG